MFAKEDLMKQNNEKLLLKKDNSWNLEEIKNMFSTKNNFVKNDKNFFSDLQINQHINSTIVNKNEALSKTKLEKEYKGQNQIKIDQDDMFDELLFNELDDNDKSNISKVESSFNHRKCCRWTKEEDELLIALVEEFEGKSWKKISSFINNRSPIQCLHRWTKILKPGLVKGPWTTEEDNILINWVKKNGVANFINCNNIIPGRNSKQCRERWINVLNPKVVKGEWTLNEDYLIFKLYITFGGKWIKFVSFFKGIRAENSIKNRFYSTIRRFNTILKKQKKDQEMTEIEKIEIIYCNLKHKIMEVNKFTTEEELKYYDENVLGFCYNLDEKDPINKHYSKKDIFDIAQKYMESKDKKIIKNKNINSDDPCEKEHQQAKLLSQNISYNEAKIELSKKRQYIRQLGQIISKNENIEKLKDNINRNHNYTNDFAISISGSLESNMFSSNIGFDDEIAKNINNINNNNNYYQVSNSNSPNNINKNSKISGINQIANINNMDLDDLEKKILMYCNSNEINLQDDWNANFNNQISNIVEILDQNYNKFMNNNYHNIVKQESNKAILEELNEKANENTNINNNLIKNKIENGTRSFTNLEMTDTRHETNFNEDFREIEKDVTLNNQFDKSKSLISEDHQSVINEINEKSNFDKLLNQLNELEELIKVTKKKLNQEESNLREEHEKNQTKNSYIQSSNQGNFVNQALQSGIQNHSEKVKMLADNQDEYHQKEYYNILNNNYESDFFNYNFLMNDDQGN